MRLSKRSVLQDPYICHFCMVPSSNARPRLGLERKLLKSVSLPQQRKASQLCRPSDEQRQQFTSKLATRSFSSVTYRSAKKQQVLVRQSTLSRKPSEQLAQPSDLLSETEEIAKKAQGIIESNKVPDETEVLDVLNQCYSVSEIIIFGTTSADGSTNSSSATASLLNLQESDSEKVVTRPVTSSAQSHSVEVRKQASDKITSITYDLLVAPQVFISPSILDLYVRIVCLLGTPEHLPEIFSLYANKPIPNPKTSDPIQYSASNPRAPSNAIPKHLADAALTAAIATKDLPLALSIIDTTVKAPAWIPRKLLREASLPILASGSLPFAAYAAATTLGDYQITASPTLATGLAFTGIMTYFLVTGTFGYIALTTFNDHHQRVRWRNIRLTERWLREDERAMFDRIALGWGFKEKWRWGEEEGADWAAIKEFCGRRGMIVDKTELLEGME